MKNFSWHSEPGAAPHWYKIYGWLPNRYLPLVMFDSIPIYKPNMKGGHTHNHQRNALERKLNRSKDSRNRCHNVLNKGFNYKSVSIGSKKILVKEQ